MSVLSVINELNLGNPKKFFFLPIVVVFFGLLYVKTVISEEIVPSIVEEAIEGISYCDENLIKNRETSKRLLFVSTLDGGVTALDLTQNGQMVWTFITEPGDLLSSSIHKLEMTSQGKYVRMIPSLSGGIYKFDGDSIEAIPVKAEDLLKSSFKFKDDIIISGGQEVRTYGVNSRTGKVLYEQSMGIRKNFSDQDSSTRTNDQDSLLDDVLVIKRYSQTVRASEPRTGEERWNFSIGHHQIQVALSDNCIQQSKNLETERLDELILDTELRVIVPEGIICAYSKKNPNYILWKYKFYSPIVSVFRSDLQNQFHSVDLFSNTRWLWEEHSEDVFIKAFGKSDLSPSLYLGMYQNQLYIQESEVMKASIEHLKYNDLHNNLGVEHHKKIPKIPFKPIPASNNALIDFISKFNDDPAIEPPKREKRDENNELVAIDDKVNAQLVLHNSHIADGRGYYFFTEKDVNHTTQCLNKKNHNKNTKTTNETPQDVDNITFQNLGMYPVRLSLWFYWKEIAVIALTTALVVNFMLRNQNKRSEREVVFVPIAKEAIDYDEEEEKLKKQQQEIEILRSEAQKMRSISESGMNNEESYSSRFLEDFDLIRCLGKGGFGVVFEVRNKLDDCNYAVKRILLPSKQESRERVLREVKTLANCEHKNIVRYFHAWVEQPPKGWQEAKDKEIFSRDICSTSITIDTPTEESKAFTVPSSGMASHKFLINGAVNTTIDSNSSYLMNLQNKSFPDFDDVRMPDDTTADDSCSFIQFKADNSETKSNKVNMADESFAIEFKELSSTVSKKDISAIDASHVISITDETSVSKSTHNNSQHENGKKTHRRNLSLDLASSSNVLPKKLNCAVGSPVKMYLYIQMQLCMKTCLKDWLKENDLSARNGETIEIWNQIIQAVHYVHLKGLIHRDLKPSNIFFALDHQVKIGDFGLVTDMAEQPVDPITSSSSSASFDFDLTVIGHKKHTQRVGTSLYMSPEQSKGLAYNYKVDIYSLGLIFFELLNFFHTETERYKVLQNIKNQKYPDEFIANYKNEFELLKLMLAKKPEERPTTYGIRARPPLNKQEEDQVSSEWHFELPTRRRDSHRSITNLLSSKSSSSS